jgi:hypothetical protein
MNIDKRSSIRKPVVLSVEVYSFNEHLGHTRTRDINLDGSFIENCSKKLYPHDLLELHFHMHDGDRNPLRLRATVVRSTDEGAGVVFDYGVEEYRRLLNTISTYASDGHTLNVPGFWYVSNSVD